MARDLHDSTGQTLTALKISVALLRRKLDNDERFGEELSEITLLADQALQEIRTTSYLLHPPLLDEAGFSSAAQCYVEGFAKRSGLTVRTDFMPEVARLPDAIETTLFRVLQESLTNAHRHSGTSEVDVRFWRGAQAVILEVRDYGCGIAKEFLSLSGSVRESGVGLAGMRERLHDLKGDLEISSATPGTRLRAIVPLFSKHPLTLLSFVADEDSPVETRPAVAIPDSLNRKVGAIKAAFRTLFGWIRSQSWRTTLSREL